MNPEFLRNLWLEFSLQRLIAAPVIIGVVVGLIFAMDEGDGPTGLLLYEAATYLARAIIFIWGGWLAAGAVLSEINAQTWELQRMSAIGAWPMTWGKLLGATAYSWYCALLLLAVALLGHIIWPVGDATSGMFSPERPSDLLWAADLLISGLMVQASAFAGGLLLAGKLKVRRRGSILLAWGLGLFAGSTATSLTSGLSSLTAVLDVGSLESVYWYDGRYRIEQFVVVSLGVFLAFAVLAGYRLMRRELQFRSWPWAPVAFVLVLTLYISGFPAARLTPDDSFAGLFFFTGFLIVLAALYTAAFLDRSDLIRYRQFFTAFGHGRIGEALGHLPWWIPLFLLGLVAVLGVELFLSASLVGYLDLDREWEELFVGVNWAPALLVLALRDIAFLLWLNLSGRYKYPDVSALIYLLLFYGPLQALLYLLGLGELAGLFYLSPEVDPLVTGAVALALAALFFLLAARNLRRPKAVSSGA